MVREVLYDTTGSRIELGAEIGRGGEGIVYEIIGQPHRVAKKYSKPVTHDKYRKLKAMMSLVNADVLKIAAWPQSSLHKTPYDQALQGFIMDRVNGCNPIHELYTTTSRKRIFPNAGWDFIIASARNLASAVGELHKSGCVIGDINESNILVANDATIKLIDCDSYQIKSSNELYLCEVGVGLYTAPELQNRTLSSLTRTTDHDNFALAVFIFRLLFLGRHPFSGKFLGKNEPPSIEEAITNGMYFYSDNAIHQKLSPPPGSLQTNDVGYDIKNYFERAFCNNMQSMNQRPTAYEWINVLDRFIKQVKRCATNPMHIYNGNVSKNCPWCKLETSLGTSIFYIEKYVEQAFTVGDVHAIWNRIQGIVSPGSFEASKPSSNGFTPTMLPLDVVSAIKDAKSGVNKLLSYMIGFLAALFFAAVNDQWLFSCVMGVIVGGVASQFLQTDPAKLIEERNKRKARLVVAQQKLNEFEKNILQSYGTYYLEKFLAYLGPKQFIDEFSKLKSIYEKLKTLEQKYIQDTKKLETNKRSMQLNQFLEGFNVTPAKIKGITPSLKASLISAGIETAADISDLRVSSVYGFGKVRTHTMLVWRKSLEARFIYDVNKAIDPREIANLKNKYSKERCNIAQVLKTGADTLVNLRKQIMDRRSVYKALLDEVSQCLADLEICKIN